uniref:Uncharacterized protein n=1 Tax=Anopheles quadriannulatus TaxID=34691 RepID=A0A182XJW1_ANOQN
MESEQAEQTDVNLTDGKSGEENNLNHSIDSGKSSLSIDASAEQLMDRPLTPRIPKELEDIGEEDGEGKSFALVHHEQNEPAEAADAQDESSDTMDEDNRLVIAEKQRRYRKKNTNSHATLTAAHQMNPTMFPYQQMHLLQQQQLYPGVSDALHNNMHSLHGFANTSLANYGATVGLPTPQTHNAALAAYPTLPGAAAERLQHFIDAAQLAAQPKGNQSKASNSKRPAERRKRNQAKPGAAGGNGPALGDLTSPLTASYMHLSKLSKPNEYAQQHQQQLPPTLPNASQLSALHSHPDSSHMRLESMANPPQVPAMQQLQPPPPPEKKKDKKKVFLCSPCGTHYENWNLFLHMREVHRKHICLYCLGIFPSAERLVSHLGTKHGVLKKHHGSLEEYLRQCHYDDADRAVADAQHTVQQQPFYLMCSRCEHMFESNVNDVQQREEQLRAHDCANYLETCGSCGQLKQAKHRCDGVNGTLAGGKKKAPKKSLPGGLGYANGPLAGNDAAAAGVKLNGNALDSGFSSTNQTLAESYGHLQYPTPVMNGELTHQKEFVPPVINATTPPAHEPSESTSLTCVVDQQANEPPPPPPAVTPLVPKLKVKIPIQYLTPMESEESSAESDDEEEDEEEEEEEEDEEEEEEEEEVKEDGEEPAETVATAEKNEQNSHAEMEQADGVELAQKIETDREHLEAPQEAFDANKPDHTHQPAEEQEQIKQDNVEVAEDTALQEPIPMDIDESLMIQRRRDVPTRASTDAKHSPEEIGGGAADEASAVAEGKEIASTDGPSDGSISLAASVEASATVEDKMEPMDAVPTPLAPETEQNEPPPQCEGVAEVAKTLAEEEASERLAAAEMLFDLSATGGEVMTMDSMQPENAEEAPEKDAMVIADSEAQLFTLTLDEPLDRIPIREFIRICLRATVPFCLYCNHARRIAVNGRQLVLHIIAMHRFQATVNSITGEELLPETILQRFLNTLDELGTEQAYLNVETFDNSWTTEQRTAVPFVKVFECFQCRFSTVVHKELYLHNRKMHQKSVLLCLMCKGNFFSYSELLCHMCPGVSNHTTALDYMFRCCVCNVDGIPSAFRLMVHLRKRHYACDVCLEECVDQSRLSNHVWKHKLHHLCYRCGIGYRNKADILKHLFWKHGTEGVLCKRCLQKKWPHVYHFCVPPAQFVCEVCQATFSRSVALKVHRRLHNGEAKYPCTEDGCEKRFISKKLLLKHVHRHDLEKAETEKEQLTASMDTEAAPADDGNAHDAIQEGSDPKRTNEDEANAADTIKTEPLPDDNAEGVASSAGATIAEGQGADAGDRKDLPIEESADKNTIKKESAEDADSAKPLEGKDGSGSADRKDQLSEDSNRKEELAKEQAPEPAPAAAEAMDVSTPAKKSKKKRKARDDDKSVVDLMNLPALNLSESDSSDDSDNENSNASFNSRRFADCIEPESGALRDDPMESKVDGVNLMHGEDAVDREQTPEEGQQRKEGAANEDDQAERSENASQELAAPLDPIANIWNNFKRYQANHRTASRKQSADEEQRLEDELVERMLKTTILHVSQSDHDYCMMFKPILSEAELEAELQSKPQQESLLLKGGRDAEENVEEGRRTPEAAVKSSSKRNNDQSSDSEDSSDSDSSCECGSNCSCSSSSSNSSSSSSDDSDSSDNEDTRKGSKKGTGADQPKKEEDEAISPAVSAAEAVAQPVPEPEEVEELPPPEPVDPDSVIVDSDLHTDESETDEEFYDEHPQKLANQLLAEKRRQLLAQTGASMNYGMVENSRPSTPSLPPEEVAPGKKKVKPKKRKRERKSSKRFMSPAGSTFVEQQVPVTNATLSAVPAMDVVPYVPQHIPYHWPQGEQQHHQQHLAGFTSHGSAEMGPAAVTAPSLHTPNQPQQMQLAPAMAPLEMPAVPPALPVQSALPAAVVAGDDLGKISAPRLSTGNSSESDAPLKRSQRSRKPNKFYGYTSDDESAAASLPLPSGLTLSTNPEKSILSLMKPTPPPNLVWSKEDLPSPPTKSSKTAGGAGASSKATSGQRRSIDHLTPVSSRRNSGIGMTLEELGSVPPAAAAFAEQQYPTVQQLATPTVMMPSFDPSTPTTPSHPPLPKLKLSLGKKSTVASVTPKGVRQPAANSRRRKPATPRTPKVKTPKSAPPMGLSLHGSPMLLPTGTPGTPGPLSAPLIPAAGGVASSALYQTPTLSAAEPRPKIPPIGSFPSIQTDLFRPNQIRVPAGWRAPKEGESVYCYCRAPYDEVSEMIACDDDNCRIEWFHFECVGIIMPPKGKWFCPDCKLRQVQSGTVLSTGLESMEEGGQSATTGHAVGGDAGMSSSLAVATSTNGGPSLAQPSSVYTHWGQPQ